MSTYAIGDVQGCFRELQDLLRKIHFNPSQDKLWFSGDLVNRGPESLATLRFVRDLDAITVLGNHDLHLLAISEGIDKHGRKDTLDEILNADDSDELLHWLRHRPLLHHDPDTGYVMVHAGLPPQWDLRQACELAAEVEQVLASKHYGDLLDHMYGNTPDVWSDDLRGKDRYRFIINAFTRIRFCDRDGAMDFHQKGPPGSAPASLQPWFTLDSRKTRNNTILFGHWAAIYAGNISDFHKYRVYPLDTGCVWGDKLTAMRLEDGKLFQVPSRQPKSVE
jgi:bis(5'-nucleosyl)-tetraphosphatase (symmetrical)